MRLAIPSLTIAAALMCGCVEQVRFTACADAPQGLPVVAVLPRAQRPQVGNGRVEYRPPAALLGRRGMPVFYRSISHRHQPVNHLVGGSNPPRGE